MSYHILVASLTLMVRAIRVRLATSIQNDTLMKIVLRTGASLQIIMFTKHLAHLEYSMYHILVHAIPMFLEHVICQLDWLQSLKQFFMNVSYHIIAVILTLMALF